MSIVGCEPPGSAAADDDKGAAISPLTDAGNSYMTTRMIFNPLPMH